MEIDTVLACEAVLLLICVFLAAAGAVCAVVVLTSKHYPVIQTLEGEDKFYDPNSDEFVKWPSLTDPASLYLSVVVPAYNEEERLPKMLRECVGYLEVRRKEKSAFSYEIIVVDDGSRDETAGLAHEWSERYGADKIRVLKLARNRGKGGAVRMGMLRARGEYVLFADADGATKFADLEKLEEKMESVEGVVCGSRAHLEQEAIAQRSVFRTFLMFGFHTCVRLFGTKSIKDTQCGFKLLTRRAALVCFSSLHIERWAFDVELLKIAEILDIPTGEVSVRWTEIDGSKLNPILASLQMFRDLFLLWLRYALCAWRVRTNFKKTD